jgi:four helix bundle protein
MEVWKQSIQLIKIVYMLTKKLPKEEQFNLVSQMRRASVSVCSNIAEGASRRTELERKRFYEISRSSLVELDTQVEICLVLEYLEQSDLEHLKSTTIAIFKMMSKLAQREN